MLDEEDELEELDRDPELHRDELLSEELKIKAIKINNKNQIYPSILGNLPPTAVAAARVAALFADLFPAQLLLLVLFLVGIGRLGAVFERALQIKNYLKLTLIFTPPALYLHYSSRTGIGAERIGEQNEKSFFFL